MQQGKANTNYDTEKLYTTASIIENKQAAVESQESAVWAKSDLTQSVVDKKNPSRIICGLY